jgi:signal transduction histidine kinase
MHVKAGRGSIPGYPEVIRVPALSPGARTHTTQPRMASPSAHARQERTRVAGGALVETRGRPVPGALELALLALLAVVIVDASAGVAADADPLAASFRAAYSFLGPVAWPVGFILLAMSIGLVHRAAPRAAVPDSAADDGLGREPAVGDATLLALENARLEAELRASTYELRRSRTRIATAAAAERRRLERELHDRAQNRLVGLQIRLRLARDRAEESAPDVATMLAALGEQAEAVGEELRRIAHGICPPLLVTRGLVEALTAEAGLSGVAVRTYAGEVGFSAPEVELAVYLCCLEALQNAAKHAGPDVAVTVRLGREGEGLAFSVEDDGRGFDPPAAGGSGLTGMRDRIGAVGGWIEVASAPGHGTTVAGAVPWPARSR